MKIIAPSMLSCNFGKLKEEIEMVNQSEAGWFHLDIMDGVFVPNITFGTPILEVFKEHASKHLDAHLMIVNPENYIEKFASLGANTITVHYEACDNLQNTINQIKKLNVKAGVAINPDTDVSVLYSFVNEIDSLPKLYKWVTDVLGKNLLSFEIIFVLSYFTMIPIDGHSIATQHIYPHVHIYHNTHIHQK